jgi:signal peptide peptidase SppA
MASAAYWIGSAAGMIFISGQTPMVGSVGVVTAHVDYSSYEEKIGVKTTEIYAGKYKRIASEHKPLSSEGKEYLQGQVDYLYKVFADAVSSYRPSKLPIPAEGTIPWAEGKIFTGIQALDVGLVDGVATQDQLLAAMSFGASLLLKRASVYEKFKQ